MLANSVKEEVLANTASYTTDNKKGITKFFNQHILPLAQTEFLMTSKKETVQPEEVASISQEIIEQIKMNPSLWHKIEQCPEALKVAGELVQQSQQQKKQLAFP